ncbi:hypothetical protein SAICODRAFT_73347 [Saitoella complicata NRRL Y-17804]|uniref:Uncharacterized protein n=1 Tax=Saitoella complicata (strain BCRC 22490 / CBS 7301 / JCM 7358 / NBRC 10748 / NRRL Y-17804) TaxID=698492 RepID=A0A0E9NLQ6_SAICN|nr:uncharacterized protein SAICODRAFT_73347 [Saitoella complicata NRRL Y-17804]ODQ50567.1 hypothetical protein SAICODRAFT_73347 [Saitoella complicata NRRL Y-17804]GAO50345.1 hypothetical protein G7K_4473-t1 [Saitoella complicata NRRL Y-17804]
MAAARSRKNKQRRYTAGCSKWSIKDTPIARSATPPSDVPGVVQNGQHPNIHFIQCVDGNARHEVLLVEGDASSSVPRASSLEKPAQSRYATSNSFFLFRQAMAPLNSHLGHQTAISKALSRDWDKLSKKEKDIWHQLYVKLHDDNKIEKLLQDRRRFAPPSPHPAGRSTHTRTEDPATEEDGDGISMCQPNSMPVNSIYGDAHGDLCHVWDHSAQFRQPIPSIYTATYLLVDGDVASTEVASPYLSYDEYNVSAQSFDMPISGFIDYQPCQSAFLKPYVMPLSGSGTEELVPHIMPVYATSSAQGGAGFDYSLYTSSPDLIW